MEDKTKKELWVEDVIAYIDKYGEKCVLEGEGEKLFGYTISVKLLKDALNGHNS